MKNLIRSAMTNLFWKSFPYFCIEKNSFYKTEEKKEKQLLTF